MPAKATPLFFRQAVDTYLTQGPQGHLLDLKGAWSLAANSSLGAHFNGNAYSLTGIVPFSTDTESMLHGYYLAPSYIYTRGSETTAPNYLGFNGWQIAFGRGNLNFPGSVFRGFFQIAYRDLTVNNDSSSQALKSALVLAGNRENKKSFLISTGVSSTQNSLVSQQRPLLDSELLINIRYDYEEGDFFTFARGSLFYPTWVEPGASIAWFKVFRDDRNANYDEVSDDFIFGPKFRFRAWNQAAFEVAIEWHLYRSFNGITTLPGPRAQLMAVVNF